MNVGEPIYFHALWCIDYDARYAFEEGRAGVLVHQEACQEGLLAPLQPLERLEPPLERTPALRADLEPQLERRCRTRPAANSQPHCFPEPKDEEAWATRAKLGEEMWIAERPLDRAMALNVVTTAFGLGGVWGVFRRRLLPTAICAVGQVALLLVYWHEMALYFERHREEGA